ncbi:MAG TPA: biotin transporter BioY [Candidatus Limiplasma sp.]|nr:biotin transporter BioY [Candidatus Limiplasma sp.]HPS82498.1 biotin transporter BioY [Candidatus Limiplasma sp.]
MPNPASKLTTLDMVYIALFAVLIAICAWISIPSTVPFTLQTFAVLCTMGLLGGRRSVLAVTVYLLLGMVGIPVFSGFRGGLGMLLGVTGGYLVGFLVAALCYWLITAWLGNRYWVRIVGMIAGLILCYVFGTAWFMIAYAGSTGPVGLSTALGWCVVPFLIPEAIKTALAIFVVRVVPQRVKAFR